MRTFGFILLIYEIFICVIYGYVLKYTENNVNGHNDLLIPASIIIITLLGN